MLGIFITYFGELNIVSIIAEKNTYNDLSKTFIFQFFMNCPQYIVSRVTFAIRCVYNCDNLMTTPYTILSESYKYTLSRLLNGMLDVSTRSI